MVERGERISSVRASPSAGADLLEAGLVAVREVQAWCDAQHAGLVARLRVVDAFPEKRVTKASKKLDLSGSPTAAFTPPVRPADEPPPDP